MVSAHASQPYRNPSFQCPRCRLVLAGEAIAHCARCNGSWVAEDVLKDRISQMQHQVPPLVSWFLVEREALPCVACGQAMQTLALFDVPVDRCRGHGVWFDAEELAAVLLRSKDALDDAFPMPTRVAPGPSTPMQGSRAELAVDGALAAAHVPIEGAMVATEVGGAAVEALAVGGVATEVGGAAIEVVASGAAEAGLGIAGSVLEGILEGLTSLLP
jgi:Zn-finger nucleic acid-binding protein